MVCATTWKAEKWFVASIASPPTGDFAMMDPGNQSEKIGPETDLKSILRSVGTRRVVVLTAVGVLLRRSWFDGMRRALGGATPPFFGVGRSFRAVYAGK